MPRRKDPLTDAEVQRIKDLFGRSLEAMRRQQGFSNRQTLAARAGVSDESLGRIERGEGNPELTTLIRVALAMRVSLAQLFASMGQTEGLGRQLTVHERTLAVTGLTLMLESLAGAPAGEAAGQRPAASPTPARDLPTRRRRRRRLAAPAGRRR